MREANGLQDLLSYYEAPRIQQHANINSPVVMNSFFQIILFFNTCSIHLAVIFKMILKWVRVEIMPSFGPKSSALSKPQKSNLRHANC